MRAVPDLQAGAAARPAPDAALDHSYRALLRVPTLGRVLLAMQLARIGQAMVAIALVLFTLAEYGSPVLAGIVTFASTFPGVLVSPVAGALLDRHGRTRLVTLDYVVALAALVPLGVLALSGRLPAWLLVLIAAVASLTAILSATGLRSLFPIIVPRHLWERVNAVDSNGYVVASIIGPPAAAALVTVVGGPVTLICIGVVHGCAALAMRGIPDPETETVSSGSLLRDAWQGLVYAWRNPTLRGLGFAISTLNLAGGMTTIVIPLIVLDRLRAGEPVVGLVFALSGVAGMVSALVVGRLDTRGREWTLLVLPMLATAPILAAARGRGRCDGERRPGDGPAPGAASIVPDGTAHGTPGRGPLHGPSAAHRSGLDGPRVRRLDGLQLQRLPDRRRAGRRARLALDRERHPGGRGGQHPGRRAGRGHGPSPGTRRGGQAGRSRRPARRAGRPLISRSGTSPA